MNIALNFRTNFKNAILKAFDVNNRVYKLDSRIDSEISNVKAILEAFKAETIRYIAGMS